MPESAPGRSTTAPFEVDDHGRAVLIDAPVVGTRVLGLSLRLWEKTRIFSGPRGPRDGPRLDVGASPVLRPPGIRAIFLAPIEGSGS